MKEDLKIDSIKYSFSFTPMHTDIERVLYKERFLIDLIEIIKTDMFAYGFKLNDEQVVSYINLKKIIKFGGYEREEYVDYLSLQLVGRKYHRYESSEQYKTDFHADMELKQKGYTYGSEKFI